MLLVTAHGFKAALFSGAAVYLAGTFLLGGAVRRLTPT
jgi:hypothetical protein